MRGGSAWLDFLTLSVGQSLEDHNDSQFKDCHDRT